MTKISFDLVGFDLDGTLVDSSRDLTDAVNDALQSAGRAALTVAQVTTMVGGGARHMLTQGMEATGGYDPIEFRLLYKRMLAYYATNIAVHTRPFPGAIAALDRLDALGIRSAIVTNKFENMALKLLTELGILDRFACVIGGDTMGPGRAKPHRAPIDEMIRRAAATRAIFVGDSRYDIVAARNAGIPAIAVAFGFLLDPVEEMGADAIIGSFDDLVPALAALS